MPRHSGFADRDPCPWRIVDDVGGAFCMGAIGGTIWFGSKGMWRAPQGARLVSGLAQITARAPVTGGGFAVWGGLFACCDCTLTALRQKEDPWNSIMSGAATGGILAARAGPQAMATSAMVGGILLALIEGMGIMVSKMLAPPVPTAQDYERAMQQDVTAPPTAGGLFPSFGGNNNSSSSTSSSNSSSSTSSLSSSASPMDSLYGGGGSSSSSSSDSMMDTTTTFQTESPSSDNNNNKSSWFSFGS